MHVQYYIHVASHVQAGRPYPMVKFMNAHGACIFQALFNPPNFHFTHPIHNYAERCSCIITAMKGNLPLNHHMQSAIRGDADALATVTGIVDGTGSVGAAIGQVLTVLSISHTYKMCERTAVCVWYMYMQSSQHFLRCSGITF